MDMETEDMMWKQIYKKLNETKESDIENKTEHQIRIQELDGGFFEKFGSLFRENAELAANIEKNEKQNIIEAAAEAIGDEENAANASPTTEADYESTSSSDTESNDAFDAIELTSTSIEIDDLYPEILHKIINHIGSNDIGETLLCAYIKDAFHVTNEYHQTQLNVAKKKEYPRMKLHVEVVEARDLAPKDSNGLSDPYVTLYLSSNSEDKFSTSVKEATLTPVWSENFELALPDKTKDVNLCLDVWDFDPAESVTKTVGKIFDVKGVKGVKKLMRELTVTASNDQNELIGKARVPLKYIPATGMTTWYTLDKKNKNTRQGILKVKLSFSSEGKSPSAEQEHRDLLNFFLIHELETSKIGPHAWSGPFSQQAEAIITQHLIQSGLSPVESDICQWVVFSKIHQTHPLSFFIFSKLLDSLVATLKENTISLENRELFWQSTKTLLPHCFATIRRIRKKQADKILVKNVNEVLTILSKIMFLDPPSASNLFSSDLYPWISAEVGQTDISVRSVLIDAIRISATKWYDNIVENNRKIDCSGTERLQFINQIINLVKSDVQKAIEFFDKSFQDKVGVTYAKELYTLYQQKISDLAEEDVFNMCKSLKKLNFDGQTLNQESHKESLEEGTKLFEVYLGIKRFVAVGNGICSPNNENYYINDFYKWFYGGVTQWLEIAVFKALQRIEKAVELDKLVAVDSTVRYSSSAVDTLSIFYQVKVFWQQLDWPDAEGCYNLISKIIDDICRSGVFYAQKMSRKVDVIGEGKNFSQNRFEITNEWCIAINNIEYVSQALKPFTMELGMHEVLRKMADLESPPDTEKCQQLLENVISSAVDTIRNEINELLATVISRMAPAIKKLLIDGAEYSGKDDNCVDELMMYVDNNLSTIYKELNEENFNRTMNLIWGQLNQILDEIIQVNLEKRRQPSFFANLHKTLNLMLGSFKTSDDCTNCTNLNNTEKLLRIHGLETTDLIHQVNLDLYEEYKKVSESPYGRLSVRCKFEGNNLTVEILNSKIYIAMDSNGLCDPFVKVNLLPEETFQNLEQPQTKCYDKTLDPLFDETFVMKLSDEQRFIKNGLILFSVMDKDLLGFSNEYVGEAFINFKDIADTGDSISYMSQIHLQLSRPQNLDSITMRALEIRQGEKQSKEFLKKLKQRMGTVPSKNSQ